MTRAKDNGRVSLHKLILVMRIAQCCQRNNVVRSIANLCEIHGLNPNIMFALIEGRTDLSVISMACEQEFDRLLYDWFDGADWRGYYNFDPELVRAASQIMQSPGFTTKLSMLGKQVCEKLGIPVVEPKQDNLF